ncbi:hypothetical protein CAL7716_102760 (plasmid) [Calothrix sp. PCC 7716]|nr:hypothetical protein CAL7716_102760 [Calothrix sp. PCC 7716]
MKIRLTGTEEEITGAIAKIKTCFEVSEVSKFYLNRGGGDQGRVYVKVKNAVEK